MKRGAVISQVLEAEVECRPGIVPISNPLRRKADIAQARLGDSASAI